MKKILLATDSYHYAPTANGICVEELAHEFLKEGNQVHVLCFQHGRESQEEIIENIQIHRIRMDWVNQLRFLYEKKLTGFRQKFVKAIMIILNRFEAIAFLHWFPIRSPLFCYRYTKKIEKLQNLYNYDIIIASYAPFEAAYALYKLDKKYIVKKCLYTLDSFTNLKQRFFLSPEFQDKKGWEWEKKIYGVCDLILNMKCHESHYSQDRYFPYIGKMKIVDIPHMIFDNSYCVGKQIEKQTIILYAGAIRKDIFPYVMRLLTPFLRGGGKLEIYGRTTIDFFKGQLTPEILKNVYAHGFVDREEVLKAEKHADILLSMGNSNSDFIPSKIFEYIASGQKILHIYNYEHDSALPYYLKYPNSCCINTKDDFYYNMYKFERFMRLQPQKMSFKYLKETYYMNTPEYTVHTIMSLFKEE